MRVTATVTQRSVRLALQQQLCSTQHLCGVLLAVHNAPSMVRASRLPFPMTHVNFGVRDSMGFRERLKCPFLDLSIYNKDLEYFICSATVFLKSD